MINVAKSVLPEPTKSAFINSELKKFECWHCHKQFTGGVQSVKVHLQHCPARLLNRFFRVDKYLIVLVSNPLRRKVYGFAELCRKFPDNITVIVGALKYLECTKELHAFHVVDAAKSPDFLALQPGLITRKTLLSVLTPETLADIRKVVDIQA
jgi:hypothetical protein